MIFRSGLNNIIQILSNNKKIVENYFFMTVLQVLNSMFYLLIYPFLIRTLGAESYGFYVFAMSITTYFIVFVSFGFDLPAVKSIAEKPDDNENKTYTLSCVFTAKIYLEIISILLFGLIIILIPTLRVNWLIFLICFIQTISGILFPQWYFQGVQRMRFVTYIQLLFKLISIPFILLLIKGASDIWIFALITTSVSVFGAIMAAIIVRGVEKVKISWMSFREVLIWYKDALPFFLSSSTTVIKDQSIIIVIGFFFGMKEVALFDLANKIIMVPRILLSSLNAAIFPKIISNINHKTVKKIIKYESVLGLIIIGLIVLFGKWFVVILGGILMYESYTLSIILSITVFTWLVVGSYINFVFIPQNRYYYVTTNQLIALFSFILYSIVGLTISNDIHVLAYAISLSGITEIIYCKYVTDKRKMLIELPLHR